MVSTNQQKQIDTKINKSNYYILALYILWKNSIFLDLQCERSTVAMTFYNRKEIRCQGSLNPIVLTTDVVQSILDNKNGEYKVMLK